MSDNYTPSNTFHTPPWLIAKTQDDITLDFFNSKWEPAYDNIHYINEKRKISEESITKLLAFTGIDPTWTELTFNNPYVLLPAISNYKAALEALDAKIKQTDEYLSKINTKVGGDFATTSNITYASTEFISDGMTHHAAIETLDEAVGALDESLGTQVTNVSNLGDTQALIVGNVGVGSDTADGMDFLTNYIFTDGESVKALAEKIDRILDGQRRELYRLKQAGIESWATSLSFTYKHSASFYDDTDDGVDISTTCVRDHYRVLATGEAGQFLLLKKMLATSVNTIVLNMVKTGGAVSVEFNTHGSVSQFTAISQAAIDDSTPVATDYSSGTELVIKVTFTADADISEIRAGLTLV